MSRKRRAPIELLVAVGTLAVVLVTSLTADSRTSQTDSATAGAYAYITRSELVLMRDEQVVSRVQRFFDPRDFDNQVAWTHDSNYLAVLTGVAALQGNPDDEKIVVINVENGEQAEVPCPRCTFVVATGGRSTVLTNPGMNHPEYKLLDLKKPGQNSVDVSYPDLIEAVDPFLAATEHSTLLKRQVRVGTSRYRDELSIVDWRGQQFRMRPFYVDSGRSMPVAARNGKTADGDLFAFAATATSSCRTTASVYVASGLGKVEELDVRALELSEGARSDGVEVLDLWWDGQGVLNAAIQSWTCAPSDDGRYEEEGSVSAPKNYRLSGTQWVMDGSGEALVKRTLTDQSSISLTQSGCSIDDTQDPACDGATLVLSQASSADPVAEGVLSIYTPPVTFMDASQIEEKPDMTSELALLRSASVPSLCDHDEGTLVNGSLPGIPENRGYVTPQALEWPERAQALLTTGDITGDRQNEIVVVYACSRGGTNWPNSIVIYGSDWSVRSAISLGELVEIGQAEVVLVEINQGRIDVQWDSYFGAAQCKSRWAARLSYDGQRIQASQLRRLGSVGPGYECE